MRAKWPNYGLNNNFINQTILGKQKRNPETVISGLLLIENTPKYE